MSKIFVSSVNDIPSDTHWAIISSASISIPGDERSRLNPGHGYPEHSIHYTKYVAFLDVEEWKAEIDRLTRNNREFKAVHVVPAQVTTRMVVNIN